MAIGPRRAGGAGGGRPTGDRTMKNVSRDVSLALYEISVLSFMDGVIEQEPQADRFGLSCEEAEEVQWNLAIERSRLSEAKDK